MADRIEYQQKLKDLQKHVPFLENTINKLMREPGKPREPQISKLQSLLEILTDTSRKLKLDALGRCEEVILKLQAQVEKKSTNSNMHKFMCRTPPETERFYEEENGDNNRLADARNKLKKIELVTPDSPSPPLEIPKTIHKPVVIPTEKIPIVESRRLDINVNKFRNLNKQFTVDPWEDSVIGTPRLQMVTNPTLVHLTPNPSQMKVPKWQENMKWPDDVGEKPLYQRRGDLCQPQNSQTRQNLIWNRSAMNEMPYGSVPQREIVTYDDFTKAPSPTRSIYEPSNRIATPLVQSNRFEQAKSVQTAKSSTLSKPPLSESDLQSLLSPVNSSASSSPKIDEDMDIDKLEKLRETLRKEIGDLRTVKAKHVKEIPPIPHKSTTLIPSSAYAAKPKTPKVTERVIKESDNIFGNILSSIDDKIIEKHKKEVKKDVVIPDGKKKELIKINFKNKTTEKESAKHIKDKPKVKEHQKSDSVTSKSSEKEKKKVDETKSKTPDAKSKHSTESKDKTSETKSKAPHLKPKPTDESKSKLMPTDESKSKPKPKNTEKLKVKSPEPNVKTPDESTKSRDSKTKPLVKTDVSKSKSGSNSKNAEQSKVKTPDPKVKAIDELKSSDTKTKSVVKTDSKAKVDQNVKNTEQLKVNTSDLKVKATVELKSSDGKSKSLVKLDVLKPKHEQNVKKLNDSKLDKNKSEIKDQIKGPLKSVGSSEELMKDINLSDISSDILESVKEIFKNKEEPKIKVKKKIETDKTDNKLSARLRIENEDSCSTTYSTKSDSSIEDNQKSKHSETKYANTGRLSDKYPHKRKSTDTKITDKILDTHTHIPLLGSGSQIPKNTDPRLKFLQKGLQDNPHPSADQFRSFNIPRTPSDSFLHSPPHEFQKNPFKHNDPRSEQFSDFYNRPEQLRPNNDPRIPVDPNFRPNEYHNRHDPNQYYPNPRNNEPNFQNNQQRPTVHDPRIKTTSNKNIWVRGYEPYAAGFEIQSNIPTNQYDLTKMGPIDYFETYDPTKKPLLETPVPGHNSKPALLDKSAGNQSFYNRGNQGARWNRGVSRGRGTIDHHSRNSLESRGRGSEHHSRGTDRYFRGSDHRGQNHPRGKDPFGRGAFSNRSNSYERSELQDVDMRIGRKNSIEEKHTEVTDIKETDESKLNIEQTLEKKGSIQNFKIPKIKKPVIEEKIEPDVEKLTEEPVKTESVSIKEEQITEATTSNVEDSEQNKTEPKSEEKTDMVNEFIQKLLQQGDTSVFINILEKLGDAIPKLKQKRIRRIIESDSENEESTEEAKPSEETVIPENEKEPEKPPEEIEETPVEVADNIIESVGERIKSRRRIPPKPEETKQPKKIRKKRSSLEMLQDDIREMFISEDILTASERQRMCRILREQEDAFQKNQDSPKKTEEPKPKSPVPPKRGVGRPPKNAKITRSPRVVLEKTDMSKYHLKKDGEDDGTSADEEIQEKPKKPTKKTELPSSEEKVTPRSTRRTRSSVKIDKEIENDSDNTSIVSSISEKNDSPQKTKKTVKKQMVQPEIQAESDNESLASLTNSESTKNDILEGENGDSDDNTSIASSSVSEKNDPLRKMPKGKIAKKKKRSNWAMGVIKNLPKKKTPKQKLAPKVEEKPVETEEFQEEIEEKPKEIDLTPDLNYYLDNKKTEKFCKLCPFKGRFIVHHYCTKHKDYENMISRLSPKMAELAKEESKRLNFESVEPFNEQFKLKKDRVSFCCRFCSVNFKNERAGCFYDHVSIHTGEYRYSCEKCDFKTSQRRTLNTHFSTIHTNAKRNTLTKPLWVDPPDYRIVFGYICDLCNFTQLERTNVENHLKLLHGGEDGKIIKISMSSRTVSLLSQEVKPVEKVEAPKLPDLKVFMTSESIDNEDKRIEAERLQKMQEVCDKLKNAKRSGLLFVNKLHDKLNTVSEEPISTPMEEEAIEEIPEIKEPEIVEPVSAPIVSICTFTPDNPPEPAETVKTEITPPKKLIQQTTKRKAMFNTIQRLTANLQNSIELPKVTDMTKNDRLPLRIKIGVLEVTIYDKNNRIYTCLVENCKYTSANVTEAEFKNHCINAHRASYGACTICAGLPMDIIGNYYHLNEVHCTDRIIKQFEEAREKVLQNEKSSKVKEVEVETPVLKIRKMPGDLLSAKKIEEVVDKTPESFEDFGFAVQILNVKTLSLEEEKNMYEPDKGPPPLTLISEKKTDVPEILKIEKDKALHTPFQLKSFFKCPENCDYATNSKHKFNDHFKAFHCDSAFKCFLCAYCDEILTGKDFANHIEKRHGHCSFVCVYCNFRACEKNYVEVHERSMHFKKKIIIVKLDNVAENNLIDDPININKAVLPYLCRQGQCLTDFLVSDDFIKHAVTRPNHRSILCHMCIPAQAFKNYCDLVKHYLTHRIGKYQCRYCVHACSFPEEMFRHYTEKHQTQKPQAILRSVPKLTTETTVQNLEIVDLSYLYEDSIHKAIPFDEYAKEMGVVTAPEEKVESTPKILDETIDSQSGLNEIETIDLDLIDDDSLDSDKQENPLLNEPLIILKHKNPDTETALANAVDPLSIDSDPLETIEPSNESETIEPSNESEIPKPTEANFDIFKCGTTDCNFVTDTATKFKEHLFSCDILKEGGYYNCIHCTKKFKYPWALTEHIQVHGTLRYVCSICDHRVAFEHIITKHMKIKHKIHTCKVVPNDELFIAVPNYKSLIKQPVSNESNEEKICFEPEEYEKLPRMAIYSQERKCAQCGFSSKVRTNLFRHLQAHLKDEHVPEIAPVNPVPCLEKNEKMFDKMLNLANSSFSGRMGAKTDKNTPANDYPVFVPVSKRFVCGAEGCNYLTHDDSMLKYHFNALHTDETNYKCPHCKIDLTNETGEINIEEIVFHLRMHDLHLYKCSLCEYLHYQRHKLERHLQDKHPNKVPYIHVIRELDNSANDDERVPEIPTETPKEDKENWKCRFCRYRSQTETDIKLHITQTHGIESQYKCSLCSFKCDAPIDFKSHTKTHPNSEVLLLSSYFRCNLSEKASVAQNETETFDTTPLWRRDTTRVKNIRGILIEESRSPKKTPKSQEKAKTEPKGDLKCYESATMNLFDDSDEENSKEAIMGMIKSFGDYGFPIENKFACPFCKEYQTIFKRKFVSHICKELNYNRYKCGNCNFKAHDFNTTSEHFTQTHSKDLKPHIKPLTPDHAIERWVDKVLQFQAKEIQKYKDKIEADIDTKDNIQEIITDDEKTEIKDVIIPHEDLLVASSSTVVKMTPKVMSHKCDDCDYEGRTLKLLKKHRVTHNKPLHCKLCQYMGVNLKCIKLHFAHKHPEQKLSYTKATKRKRSTSDNEESPNKKLVMDFDQTDMIVEPNIPKDNIRYSCMHCSMVFDDLDILKLHFIHEHWTLKIKSFCKYKIQDIKSPIDTSSFIYKCKYCVFTGQSEALGEHHKEHHPNTKYLTDHLCEYLCRFCGYTNKNMNSFRKHLRNHNQGQIAYDVVQEVTSGPPVKENIHVISDENIISQSIPTFYKCKICNESLFESEEILRKHHHTFHSHRDLNLKISTLHKYKCPNDRCEFATNVLNDMKEHVREHTRTFKCVYCTADFVNQNMLFDHHKNNHKNNEFNFTIEEKPLTLNKEYKDSLLILGSDGVYTKIKERIAGRKRRASETMEQESKDKAIEDSIDSVVPHRKLPNVAKKSTAKPPRHSVAKKSTTPVKTQSEGYSFYGTKPPDFNEYRNLTTEANIQGNMVRVSVIGLQYILKLFPKVRVEDIYGQP